MVLVMVMGGWEEGEKAGKQGNKQEGKKAGKQEGEEGRSASLKRCYTMITPMRRFLML